MQQGLESELMGLPMDLSSGAICADFISSHPALTHSHLMGDLHRGVKADVHSGRWGGGSDFPWLGDCSSISITLLLLSQETARCVDESPNTPPIKSMVNPSIVWCSPVTAVPP